MKRIPVLLLLFLLSICCFSQNADINILKQINLNRNESLDQTFEFISNTAAPISIATPVVIFSVGMIKKDSTLKSVGIYIGETIVVSTVLTTILKYSVHRDRPFETYPFIEQGIPADSPSFPSGHTSIAFATATSLSIAFPKWYVIIPSYMWACSVGYSRMHLGVHYPSDVVAGALIGAGSAVLSYELNQWINKKYPK